MPVIHKRPGCCPHPAALGEPCTDCLDTGHAHDPSQPCPVYPYNYDKPHRCPECHAITDPRRLCKWFVVTCCRCGTRFTRWTRLAWLLPRLGVVCDEHRKGFKS